MTIAVDFDGTIVTHKFPDIGAPVPFAIETLRALSEEGHHIILWTVREGKSLEEAVEYCRKAGLEFFAVNSEYPNEGWTGSGVSRKIRADVYIDDSNVGGIPDWSVIYNMLSTNAMSNPLHHQHQHRHHHHKKFGFFKRLAERCRDARGRF